MEVITFHDDMVIVLHKGFWILLVIFPFYLLILSSVVKAVFIGRKKDEKDSSARCPGDVGPSSCKSPSEN